MKCLKKRKKKIKIVKIVMKNSAKYKNFFWDFDGTLFDTYDFLAISLKKALEEVGIIATVSDIFEKIKVSLIHSFFE